MGGGTYSLLPGRLLGDIRLQLVGLFLRVSLNKTVASLEIETENGSTLLDEEVEDALAEALRGPGDDGKLSFKTAWHFDFGYQLTLKRRLR